MPLTTRRFDRNWTRTASAARQSPSARLRTTRSAPMRQCGSSGTPGTGHVHWDETFKTLRQVGYDGWLTIEAFGRALPDLAAATKVWRDLFPSDVEVYTQGLRFMKEMWNKWK